MQTWSELQNIVTEQLGDDSATTVINIKRWLNIANNKLLAIIGRDITQVQRSTSIVASQRYYQLPPDAIRVAEAWIEQNGNKYPLVEISSEHEWNYLTANSVATVTYPQSFFVKGNNEIGIHPLPGTAITNGLVVSYEPHQVPMQNADYTTGTISLVQGTNAVVGVGTAFTTAMQGRLLRVDADGEWYKILTVNSATSITLENYYAGLSASGSAFTIGEAPSLPAQFHDNLADYALFRAWQRRKDRQNASDFKALWDEAIIVAREQYASKTSSAVVNARPRTPPTDIFTNRPTAVI